jgi:hypothetical protein
MSENEKELWIKIERLTGLLHKAILKLKMNAYPAESSDAEDIWEELSMIREVKTNESKNRQIRADFAFDPGRIVSDLPNKYGGDGSNG